MLILFYFFLKFLKADDDSIYFRGQQTTHIGMKSGAHNFYLEECYFSDIRNDQGHCTVIYFVQTNENKDENLFTLNIYWTTITNCQSYNGVATRIEGFKVKLDINCLCVNNCDSSGLGNSIGGIFYILDGNQNTENNVIQYMTARACSSQKKCIHYVAAANADLETHVLYSNFSNCFTTLSTEHVFSFVDTRKILKYNTFEGNVVQANNASPKKGYMLSLNNTNGNDAVNRIEYCNFIGNIGYEGIIYIHNANLDLLNTIFHNHGSYRIIDCDERFYTNFNDCVVDQDTTISWTGDTIWIDNLQRNNNQPTHTLTFFATHNCHAAISIPSRTPCRTPDKTAESGFHILNRNRFALRFF